MHRLGWLLPLAIVALFQPTPVEAGCVVPTVVDVKPGDLQTELGLMRFSSLQLRVNIYRGRRRDRLERRPALARALARRKGILHRGVLAEPVDVWTGECEARFPIGTVVTRNVDSNWEFEPPKGTTVCQRQLEPDETVLVRKL